MAFRLGVVGGSGLYELSGLTDVREEEVTTPFGAPSDVLVRGRLGEVDLVFLPRHGRGHRLAPHEIDYRANVAALKLAGVDALLSISAVGSLKEEVAPGHFVVVDQYLDRTWGRPSTFFEGGVVAHVAFAEPTCPLLGAAVADAAERAGATVHRGGTYLCMQGPQFSTRAESVLHRSWGAAVVGMTALPEAKLAREVELPYATLALATDYDAWHAAHEPVTLDQVLRVMHANVALARRTLAELCAAPPDLSASAARNALRDAIVTREPLASPEVARRLGWLLSPSRGSS